MKAFSAFYETRQPVIDLQLGALWSDLTAQADKNTQRHLAHKRVKETKFAVINKAGYHVNVILSVTNNVCVRGKVCNEFSQLREAIENISD